MSQATTSPKESIMHEVKARTRSGRIPFMFHMRNESLEPLDDDNYLKTEAPSLSEFTHTNRAPNAFGQE
jgi:hypothetical protein